MFGDVNKKKERMELDIREVQRRIEVAPTNDLLATEEKLLKEFDTVLEQEETLWFQKSREKWIALGDRNTRYFHTSTIKIIRRRRNKIDMLKDDDGIWVSDGMVLENMAMEYYAGLYSLSDVPDEVSKLPSGGFTRLSSREYGELDGVFSEKEVKEAVQGMGKFKAPGPDGPVFYQENWELVKESVTRFVLGFFTEGVLPQGTNDVTHFLSCCRK